MKFAIIGAMTFALALTGCMITTSEDRAHTLNMEGWERNGYAVLDDEITPFTRHTVDTAGEIVPLPPERSPKQ